jgi:hypothetical protein
LYDNSLNQSDKNNAIFENRVNGYDIHQNIIDLDENKDDNEMKDDDRDEVNINVDVVNQIEIDQNPQNNLKEIISNNVDENLNAQIIDPKTNVLNIGKQNEINQLNENKDSIIETNNKKNKRNKNNTKTKVEQSYINYFNLEKQKIINLFDSIAGLYNNNKIYCTGICNENMECNLETLDLSQLKLESDIIEISEEQKQRFAGNMLQVMGDKPYLVMSKSAFVSLTEEQKNKIEKHCSIIYSSIDTIESCGGGSARCMMAEVFLPKKKI